MGRTPAGFAAASPRVGRSRALGRAMTMALMACAVSVSACGGGAGGGEGVGPGGASADAPAPAGPLATVQERQCQDAGWHRAVVTAAGLERLVLWKAPPDGRWRQGALIVMHGGGGSHTNFCVANVPLIEPQVRFTAQALAAGFAVFLLDSSDRTSDQAGRLCGKVWDDEVHPRASLDLPFIDQVLGTLIPAKRPPDGRPEIFATGLSSGGYMTVRAASRFGDRLRAIAPVSSGDPYGWARDCTPQVSDRSNVFGVARDVETGRTISEPGACRGADTSRERPWDTSPGGARPAFRQFHHEGDAIHDVSCVEKVAAQLVAHGFGQTPALRLTGPPRDAAWHYWLDEYNAPMLAFFSSFIR
ncbi:MAG: hypothetical protein KAY46_00800 [Burkholderiaceae bacterium]|nr:hypothetical protein [Burkholderiaceae bacterium]